MEALKSIRFGKAMNGPELTEDELNKINRQTLRPLTAEQVFAFAIDACDDQIDRDFEHFSLSALKAFSGLFVGKTVIFDHDWSAKNQTARIYDAAVIEKSGAHCLRLNAYMLKNDKTASVIEAICGGILREVSVGVAVGECRCDICAADFRTCGHDKGQTYGGKVCTVTLDAAVDAYEMSFVAVPAQKNAGVVKSANVSIFQDDFEKLKILRKNELALIDEEEKSIQKIQEELAK